jgi:uncharacterized protein (DUF427 family)
VRGYVGGHLLFDTTNALYVWDFPFYPQYAIPWSDVEASLLVDEERTQTTRLGTVAVHGIRAGDVDRPGVVRRYVDPVDERLHDYMRVDWAALDAWFEEDEQVFVHPRNPYVRVDALRSTRQVRVEIGGVVLADTSSPVLLFETGLPTRYYINRTDIDFAHLTPTDTLTECPYKGRTSGYWTATVNGQTYDDLAWAYDFPTPAVHAIAGMVAFYNERIDLFVDGQLLERPVNPRG